MKEILEITLDREEARDLWENLTQCETEGWLIEGDPSYYLFKILEHFLKTKK